MGTKLNNQEHLFKILDLGVDEDSITIFIANEYNVVISRKEFESHLSRIDKITIDYWSFPLYTLVQDLYEFIIMGMININQLIGGSQNPYQVTSQDQVAA